MDESMELAVQLDKHRNAIEQKERQGDQILKALRSLPLLTFILIFCLSRSLNYKKKKR